MHLPDGALTVGWVAAYDGLALILLTKGVHELQKTAKKKLQALPFTAVFTAVLFVISAVALPIPGATDVHPSGTPLAAIFLGPWLTVLAGALALFFQALFFTHGGFLTLGANLITLAVLGGVTGWAVFKATRGLKIAPALAAGLAGFLGNLAIYIGTALQLALVLHENTTVLSAFFKLLLLYSPELIVAILEGIFTGMVVGYVYRRRPEFLAFTREEL